MLGHGFRWWPTCSPGCGGAVSSELAKSPTGPFWGGPWLSVSGIVSGLSSPSSRSSQDIKLHLRIIRSFCQPCEPAQSPSCFQKPWHWPHKLASPGALWMRQAQDTNKFRLRGIWIVTSLRTPLKTRYLSILILSWFTGKPLLLPSQQGPWNPTNLLVLRDNLETHT